MEKEKRKEIPFNEKHEIVCTDCCRNCEAYACPNNKTRCEK